MFDASLFKSADTTRLFYSFILDLKQTISNATVTKTHKFIQNLNTQGKLLRCYTQNIDDLDKRAGLTVGDKVTDKCIQVHGDLDIVYCTFCKMTMEFNDDIRARFSELNISCHTCQDKNLIRKEMGKRLHTVGCLRPNIVLYNEYHPKGICG